MSGNMSTTRPRRAAAVESRRKLQELQVSHPALDSDEAPNDNDEDFMPSTPPPKGLSRVAHSQNEEIDDSADDSESATLDAFMDDLVLMEQVAHPQQQSSAPISNPAASSAPRRTGFGTSLAATPISSRTPTGQQPVFVLPTPDSLPVPPASLNRRTTRKRAAAPREVADSDDDEKEALSPTPNVGHIPFHSATPGSPHRKRPCPPSVDECVYALPNVHTLPVPLPLYVNEKRQNEVNENTMGPCERKMTDVFDKSTN
ncbi:hypothetical protein BN1723_015234 [Verticillium longisporum]|uniref:Uncharacterized protein n=1 Tax=Verticillium longisporum TaxID=100787 RepID=A0A0G4MU46_VERLO|nr:hypothetical protein BN1708_014604 [Verticillium longisporum]CRK37722.1 hypothetical protein BN1723_015234 [Verticillium longisporum]